MYTGFKHLHSFVAYILLAVFVFSILFALIRLVQKKSFSELMRKVALGGLISMHLQFLIGIILYLVSPLGLPNLMSGDAMQSSLSRLYALEHPLIMLLAVVVVTVGYRKIKKPGDDVRRYKTLLLFYTIALILVLSRIPWQVWPAV